MAIAILKIAAMQLGNWNGERSGNYRPALDKACARYYRLLLAQSRLTRRILGDTLRKIAALSAPRDSGLAEASDFSDEMAREKR